MLSGSSRFITLEILETLDRMARGEADCHSLNLLWLWSVSRVLPGHWPRSNVSVNRFAWAARLWSMPHHGRQSRSHWRMADLACVDAAKKWHEATVPWERRVLNPKWTQILKSRCLEYTRWACVIVPYCLRIVPVASRERPSRKRWWLPHSWSHSLPGSSRQFLEKVLRPNASSSEPCRWHWYRALAWASSTRCRALCATALLGSCHLSQGRFRNRSEFRVSTLSFWPISNKTKQTISNLKKIAHQSIDPATQPAAVRFFSPRNHRPTFNATDTTGTPITATASFGWVSTLDFTHPNWVQDVSSKSSKQ